MSVRYETNTDRPIGCDFERVDTFGAFRDWILDMQWIASDEDDAALPSKFALIFAHNFVEIWDRKSAIRIDHVQCEERYGARFFHPSPGTLRVASGTVFNEVLLWDVNGRKEDGDGEVVKRLVGHEGVIFSMRWSENGKLIASSSDDRTVRIWETAPESRSRPRVLFGHTARVWDCPIVGDRVVTIAEDSTCRVWNIEEEECIACWEGHDGKNVWSVDVDPTHAIVVTGGGDSGIRLWSLSSLKLNAIDSDEKMVRLSSCQSLNGKYSKSQVIKAFALLDHTRGIVSTVDGRFLTFAEETQTTLEPLYEDPAFAKYSVISAAPGGRVAAAANIVGDVILLSPSGSFEPAKFNAHDGKINILFWFPAEDPDVLNLFSFAGATLELRWHRVEISKGQPQIHPMPAITLPPTFFIVDVHYSPQHSLLILGSRAGAIAAYITSTTSSAPLTPAVVLRRVHGREAVTAIAVDPRETESGELLVATVGRDGVYCQFAVRRGEGAVIAMEIT
ncbi:WD40-repeat-containing domain protein, partial [Blyttiomyces helicus]